MSTKPFACDKYPKFFPTQVGLTAATMKHFQEADVEALCQAFYCLTLHDPLGAGITPAAAWENYKTRSRLLEKSREQADAASS